MEKLTTPFDEKRAIAILQREIDDFKLEWQGRALQLPELNDREKLKLRVEELWQTLSATIVRLSVSATPPNEIMENIRQRVKRNQTELNDALMRFQTGQTTLEIASAQLEQTIANPSAIHFGEFVLPKLTIRGSTLKSKGGPSCPIDANMRLLAPKKIETSSTIDVTAPTARTSISQLNGEPPFASLKKDEEPLSSFLTEGVGKHLKVHSEALDQRQLPEVINLPLELFETMIETAPPVGSESPWRDRTIAAAVQVGMAYYIPHAAVVVGVSKTLEETAKQAEPLFARLAQDQEIAYWWDRQWALTAGDGLNFNSAVGQVQLGLQLARYPHQLLQAVHHHITTFISSLGDQIGLTDERVAQGARSSLEFLAQHNPELLEERNWMEDHHPLP